MEKFVQEVVKQNLGKSLFLLLTLVGLVVSCYYIEKPYAWHGVLLSFIAFITLLFFYKPENTESELNSSKWFSTIQTHLRNATHVTVYLREFDHPDEFKTKHRDSLLAINRQFVKCILEFPDTFRIVAYNDKGRDANSALGWLREQLKQQRNDAEVAVLVKQCVCLIERQPHANSSTVYIIDNQIFLFNHVEDSGKARYFFRSLPRSIVPHFIGRGIEHLFQEQNEPTTA